MSAASAAGVTSSWVTTQAMTSSSPASVDAGTAMTARAVGVAVQLALSLTLLPRIGAKGASIGVFGASLVSGALLVVMVRRYARSRLASA